MARRVLTCVLTRADACSAALARMAAAPHVAMGGGTYRPVTVQGQTNRSMYFPEGATWTNLFTKEVVQGGKTMVVDTPLENLPVYIRG